MNLFASPAPRLLPAGQPAAMSALPDLEGVVVVAVSGELDLHTAPELRDTLRDLLPPSSTRLRGPYAPSGAASGQRRATAHDVAQLEEVNQAAGERVAAVRAVVVDLLEVDFMDSYALGILVHGHHLARRSGGGYALVATNPRIGELFVVTGLSRVMPLHPHLLTALAHLCPGSAS